MTLRTSYPALAVGVALAIGNVSGGGSALLAQTDSTAAATLPGSEVRVEKLFDARLLDARRIDLAPTLPSLDTSLVPQTYEVVAVESDIAYAPPRIRPLAVKVEPPETPYKGFARAGAGLPAAFLGDLGYATNTERYALRADAHTYGFKGNLNDDQRYAEVNARLGGTLYATEQVAVDLDVDYDRRQFRYYGFEGARRDTNAELLGPDRQQHFGILGLRAGIRNAAETAPGVDYRVHVTTDFLTDNFGVDERQLGLTGMARKDFTEAWYAELATDVTFVRYAGAERQRLNVVEILPTVGAHFDKVGLRLGANVANEDDAFRFYPNLEATYAISPTLVLIAGADGGPRPQSYRALSGYLPFLVSDPEIRIAQELRVFGGVQTRVRGVDLEVTAGYTRVNNLALFVTDSAQVYKFRPRYDSADVLSVKAEASAPILARLSGNLLVEARTFSLETAEDPYLLPGFDAQLRLRYAFGDERLAVSGLLVSQNALPALAPGDLTAAPATGTLFDFSVHGEYRFAERFGAFAQANNLFNNRRRKFPYYPTLGINLLAGVTARF